MADEYKTILSGVRPARVCVLVDRTDPDWRNSCLHIIEFFTALWGGAYNVIVPTDGETIPEIFWRILETYDPDYLFRYVKTGADVKASRPDEYNRRVEEETARFTASNPGADRDQTRKFVDEQFERATAGKDPMPNDKLQEEIKRRLAPFWFEKYIVDAAAVHAGSVGMYPLTSITAILPNCDSPRTVLSPHVSLSGIPSLWHAATTGTIHTKLAENLTNAGIGIAHSNFQEDQRNEFMRLVMTDAGEVTVQESLKAVFPFRLAMTQLALYQSLKFRYREEQVLLVAGDTVDDFCLYYCLSRLHNKVNWLLPEWVSRFQEAMSRAQSGGPKLSGEDLTSTWFLDNVKRLTQYGRTRASLLSVSMEQLELTALRDSLLTTAFTGSTTGLEIAETDEVLDGVLRFPLVAYEKDNYPRDITKHFTDDEITGFFDTPKPKNFKTINPTEHRWITELSVAHHQFPRHAALGASVLPSVTLGTPGVRCGRNGVAYFCPNFMTFGGDVDNFLIRPKIRTPDAFQIFRYLALQEHLTCKVSDKGFYAEDSLRKFGGLQQIGSFLRDGQRRALLDKFLDRTRPAAGVNDEGVLLSDGRRYLNLLSITKTLGTIEGASELIDELIASQVFYRGFIFKCAFCRNADWFSVDDVSHEFKCKRCGRSQVYVRSHWREPEEPTWYYQLDELVYQGYSNDMAVPFLALDYLRRKAEDSFLYSNELEFYKPNATKPFLESDLCCIPSGVLTVGEAKKGNRLGENAEDEAVKIGKYRNLCDLLAPRQIVFATMAPAWANATRTKIEEAFPGKTVRPVFLTSAELLSG